MASRIEIGVVPSFARRAIWFRLFPIHASWRILAASASVICLRTIFRPGAAFGCGNSVSRSNDRTTAEIFSPVIFDETTAHSSDENSRVKLQVIGGVVSFLLRLLFVGSPRMYPRTTELKSRPPKNSATRASSSSENRTGFSFVRIGFLDFGEGAGMGFIGRGQGEAKPPPCQPRIGARSAYIRVCWQI